MKIFSYDSKLIRFLTLAANLMILNLCFLLCSLPVVTFGASQSALYAAAMKLYREKDESDGPVIRTFFRAFRQNFRKGTVIGLIYLAVLALLVLDDMFMQAGMLPDSLALRVFSGTGTVLFLISASWVFALQARFENSIPETIRNSLILAFTNLPVTFTAAILTSAPFVMFYYRTDLFLTILPVWILIAFSAAAYLNGMLFHKVFVQYISAEGEDSGQRKEQ